MDLALRDRVALVTGASRGIGLAIAHSLLQEGVKLGICARGEEGLTEAARELRAAGGEVFAQVCDVRERAACFETVEAIAGRFGAIDILIEQNGVWLTAVLIPDESAVARALERTEALAFG